MRMYRRSGPSAPLGLRPTPAAVELAVVSPGLLMPMLGVREFGRLIQVPPLTPNVVPERGRPATRRAGPRRGATLVEPSLVLGIFLLFIFGLIEYARFVMIYQAMQNAAREGARYAISVINPDTVTDANVEAEVLRRLKGVD